MVIVKNHVLRLNMPRGKRAEALKLKLAIQILTIQWYFLYSLAVCLYSISILAEHPDDGGRGDRNM